MSETLTDALAAESGGYVYFLADPRTTRAPRYVGSTKNVEARAHQHAKPLQSCNACFRSWKDALRADGLVPVLVVVSAHPTRAAAVGAEWRLLHRWRRRGVVALNNPRDGASAAFTLEWAGRRSRNRI